MTLAVLFRPEAGSDLLDTSDWYERQQPGLGEAFAVSVDQTVGRVEAMPQMRSDAVWGGTRILRVISRAGRPCHFSKLHHYPTDVRRGIPRRAQSKDSKVPLRAFTIACHRSISK